MTIRRNPFFIRFSERITTDANFLRLFSPQVLEALSSHTLWETTNIIRSSPGGGKTSLLRLFTPNSLLTLHAYANNPPYDTLYAKLKSLDALQDEGPNVLGVLLSCAHDFSPLEDLPLEDIQRERLFLALLNARIMLSVLRSALVLQGAKYPDDLIKLKLSTASQIELAPGVPREGTGLDYYRWACDIEEKICQEMDSVVPMSKESISGYSNLLSLWLIDSESLLFEGNRIAQRVVVMLDDVHELTNRQRRKLIYLATTVRAPTKVWIAERLEALSSDDWFSEGDKEGRDYLPIYLESYWREHPSRFESFAKDVADRRTDSASEGQITSFAGCLSDVVESTALKKGASGEIQKQIVKVRKLASSTTRYNEWITTKQEAQGSHYDRLVDWRSLEILIQRDVQKHQATFDFYELTEEELQANEKSNIRTAAQLFLKHELKLPYYYGFTRLCRIASSNIDQFLSLSGELFEQIISTSILAPSKATPRIETDRQDRVLKQTIIRRWKEIANVTDVRLLVEGIGNLCQMETYKSSAPYAPGVTGVAILMSDREKLKDPDLVKKNEALTRLSNAIVTCLANNTLEARLDYKCKGQLWMVLYLNRMFCVYFDLPLEYGGFREKSLEELASWINGGSRNATRKEDRPWF